MYSVFLIYLRKSLKAGSGREAWGLRINGMESKPLIDFLTLHLPSLDCQSSMALTVGGFSHLMKVGKNPRVMRGVLVPQEAEFQRLFSEIGFQMAESLRL